MTHIEPILGAAIIPALKHFVMATKLHPILVNFTAALIPVSVASDIIGRFLKNESLRSTAWWTLFYATLITPFTAITGWLFWMGDDNDVTGRDNLEKAEIVQILTQRIAELPDIPRKVLAMYYFEHLRLAEIAAVFRLTESRICQIHAQTILGLRAFIQRVRER